MKKAFYLFGILAVITFFLVGCGKADAEQKKQDGTVKNPADNITETFSERVIAPEKEKEIKDKYTEIHNVHGETVSFEYYGQYGTSYAVRINAGAVTQLFKSETVNGVKFNYHNSIKLSVYRDGSFCTLQEAFDNGYLTAEDINDLHDYCKEKSPTLYKE